MSNTLYQFFQHSRHGNLDTLQMILSRGEWLEIIATVVSQLKDNDGDHITVELVGRMVSTGEEHNE